MTERCARISNNGIKWDGTDVGLWPWIVGADEQWLLDTPLDPKCLLLQALDDPGKWVAAHVLLTKRWSLETGKSFSLGVEAYNGLRVMLFGDGSVQIDPSQRPKIRKQWLDALKVHQ